MLKQIAQFQKDAQVLGLNGANVEDFKLWIKAQEGNWKPKIMNLINRAWAESIYEWTLAEDLQDEFSEQLSNYSPDTESKEIILAAPLSELRERFLGSWDDWSEDGYQFLLTHKKSKSTGYDQSVRAAKQLDYDTIWWIGNQISGGSGFWGASDLLAHSNPKEMVRAWVDGLREKGYEDKDIIFYGDWTDGRHIAGNIYSQNSYKKFKEYVKENSRGAEEVKKENDVAYADKIKEFAFRFN